MTPDWLDPSPQIATFQQVALQQLKVAVRQALSAEMVYLAHTTEAGSYVQRELDRLVFELRAHVLAEQLPPQEIHHRVRVETFDPRPATWWELYKATYQQRWWMRWRTWTIRTIDTPVAVQRTVTVTVRNHWTYPRASIIPPDRLGTPVMVAIWNAQDWPA